MPLDWALALVEQRYRVFFCTADKRPTSTRGFHDAVDTSDGVFELWALHPGELVGVVTGDEDGIDAIDIDVDHLAARVWWHLNRARLTQTRIHQTRRSGYHVLFQHRAEMRCSAGKIQLGVDVRSTGGYVVWWPAVGLPVLCDSPPAPWPEWLAELARPSPLKLATNPASGRSKRQPLPRVGNSYGAKALQRAREIILRADRGRQEHVIHRESFSIGSLVGAGILPKAVALSALIGIAGAVPSLDPARPWRPGEVELKVRRGFELGIAHPRAVTIRGSQYGE
jgi:hypothetical protein